MSNTSDHEDLLSDPNEVFSIIYTTIATFVLIVGVSGNCLVFLAIYLVRRLHTKSNVFLVNLAASDIGALMTGMTTIIIGLFKEEVMVRNPWFCQMLLHVTFIFVFTSITTLQCIAVDRYLVITKPRQIYRQYLNRCGIGLLLCGTWAVGLLLTVVALTIIGEAVYVEEIHACYISNLEPKSWWSLTAVLLIACVSCIIAIPYYYTLTFLKIRKVRRKVEASSSQARKVNTALSKEEVVVTRMMLVVYITFLVCWTPFLIIHFTHYGKYPPYILHYFGCLLALINSALNPLVYAGMNRLLRRSFTKVLKCKPGINRTETSFSMNFTGN